MSGVEPLHALGLFTVSKRLEVYQIIIYEYIDADYYYASLQEDLEALDEELEALSRSMQTFLDQEEVVINGERVRPRVVGVDLSFRGSPDEPNITFFIFFKGRPRNGINYYENIYEEEVTNYPYEVYWFLPPDSRVLEVEASGNSEIIGNNIVVIRVEEGERTSGYEKIVFELRP